MKRMTYPQAVKFFENFFEQDDLAAISSDDEVRRLARAAAEAVRMLAPDVFVERPNDACREVLRAASPYVAAGVEAGRL